MEIDRAVVAVVVLLPFLLLGGGIVAAVLWKLNLWQPSRYIAAGLGHGQRDRLADDVLMLGLWFALTIVSLWTAGFIVYIALHALYFWFGSGVAAAGLFVGIAILLALPIAWAVVIRRQLHRMHAQPVRGQQVHGHHA